MKLSRRQWRIRSSLEQLTPIGKTNLGLLFKNFTKGHMRRFKFLVLTFALLLPLSGFAALAKLVSSIYYIQAIDLDQDCEIKKTIYDTNGKPLFKVCKQNYKSCVIEGTCALIEDNQAPAAGPNLSDSINDVDLLNYVKSDKNGTPLFETVDTARCPYGLGVSNICLDPYYSVAADLNFYKAGDVIFIPQLKGLRILNNQIHSGFLIVRDRGGAIKGAHRFDFYTGFNHYTKDSNPFSDIGLSQSKNTFEYRKATVEETLAFKKIRNFPNIPESEVRK